MAAAMVELQGKRDLVTAHEQMLAKAVEDKDFKTCMELQQGKGSGAQLTATSVFIVPLVLIVVCPCYRTSRGADGGGGGEG